MSQFVIVDGDDWSGIYVDGVLLTEGHSFQAGEVLQAAMNHGPVDSIETRYADAAWLEDRGRLPTKLSDVKVCE